MLTSYPATLLNSFFFWWFLKFDLSNKWRTFCEFNTIGLLSLTSQVQDIKKKIIYFNWRLITLQYCSGFCHTLTWISHGCTCVPQAEPPSHLPPHPIPQCTGFECPVSCIELGLVIYFTYGNIHVSMLSSQIIPPLPSPTESKSLFFISVSLLLFRI